MRNKLLGAAAGVALAALLGYLLWEAAPGRPRGKPEPAASEEDDDFALTGPPRWPRITLPKARRILGFDRQVRSVVADAGEVVRLEIPANPIAGLGHQIWVGYARWGSGVRSGVLQVADTSTPNVRVLHRTSLDLTAEISRWRDVRFSVPAGVTRLSLEVVSERPGAPPPAVVLSQPAVVPEGASRSRTNLVFISIDTLRADFLNTYGYEPHRTSPNIDRWAERGVAFEQVIAPTPWTVPSHVAVFTGMDPDALGMDRLLYETPRLAEHAVTLAELFRETGYLTVAFTGGGTVGARNGFNDGFYLYQENHADLGLPDLESTIEVARRWLREYAGEPFFLFLHTFDVHAPYKYDQYVSSNLDSAARQRAMYASGIAHTDRLLAQFLDFLDLQGLMDNTLVVLMGDHGEGFADEHGIPDHGRTLYDEVVRVPLILFGPGIPPARIPQQVPLQDLFATLADYFDLPLPSGISSVSLLPTFLADDTDERTVHLCCMAHDFQRRGLRKDGLKYIRSEDPAVATGPVEQLFDLTRDPQESSDLSATMASALESMRRETAARTARNAKLARDTEPLEMDETYREQLRALGYIE